MSEYTSPSELAHRVRDKVREKHSSCHPEACPLSLVHAEDVQEILDTSASLLVESVGPDDPNGNGISYDPTGWHDAGFDVYYAWDRLAKAGDPIEFANAVRLMQDAMGALSSWLPGYDYDKGVVVDPREDSE